jgi:teichuronic acid biosynthesis glycosyltransferase TuaH
MGRKKIKRRDVSFAVHADPRRRALGLGSDGERPLVVVASGVRWDSVKMSEHHLAECLTRYADVLWVDSPVSIATSDPARVIGVRRRLRPSLVAVSRSLVRLRTVALPAWSRAGIRSLTWPLIRAQIRWALGQLARNPDIFVAAHRHDVLGRWGDNVLDVLYGTDDWLAGADLMNVDPKRLLIEERRALARADLVLAISGALADRWRGLGADPVVFPNGCDAEAFAEVPNLHPGPVPDRLPTPVVGVVGQLTKRIDVRMLEAVVDAGLGLLLVGPLEPKWSRRELGDLLGRSNVHHVDRVPITEVPRWLARIDVGLTPYADSAFNRASFPLKTLEYLAAGLPVVSTDLPTSRALRRETDQVWIASDPPGVVSAVREAAKQARIEPLVSERMAVAARYSWSRRTEQFARLAGLSSSSSGAPEDAARSPVRAGEPTL